MTRKRSPEHYLILLSLGLMAIGLFMAYDAGTFWAFHFKHDEFYYFKRQCVFALLGLLVLGFCSKIDYHLWVKEWRPLFFLSLLLLLSVWIPGLGRERRWIGLGPMNFQPSELAKVVLVFYLAHHCSQRGFSTRGFMRGLVPPMVLMSLLCGLILMQKDLGIPASMVIVTLGVLFDSGLKGRYFYPPLGLSSVAIPLFILSEDYRIQRIKEWFSGILGNIESLGYQVKQSLIGIGDGGIIGQGLGQGFQKLLYLPEPHTDFVFSIIGEEGGLLASAAIVLAFALLLLLGTAIALNAPDAQGRFLALGLIYFIAINALINLAVVTSIAPPKGLPLPFISYGGSNLLMAMASVGILLNISSVGIYPRVMQSYVKA